MVVIVKINREKLSTWSIRESLLQLLGIKKTLCFIVAIASRNPTNRIKHQAPFYLEPARWTAEGPTCNHCRRNTIIADAILPLLPGPHVSDLYADVENCGRWMRPTATATLPRPIAVAASAILLGPHHPRPLLFSRVYGSFYRYFTDLVWARRVAFLLDTLLD